MSDFKAKMHRIRVPLRADPAGGAYSAPQTSSCIWRVYV